MWKINRNYRLDKFNNDINNQIDWLNKRLNKCRGKKSEKIYIMKQSGRNVKTRGEK